MKKYIYLLLLVQSSLVIAQTKTVVSPYGEKIVINPYVDNGITATNGTVQLGGALLKPTTINTTSTNVLEIRSNGTSISPVSAFKLVDGTQGVNKVLVSDANGLAGWKGVGIALGVANLGTGVTISYDTNSNYLYTGTSISLPPGKWLVSVNMLLSKPFKGTSAANEFWWVRSSFSDSSSNLSVSNDVQGSNRLISGSLPPGTFFSMLSGSVIVYNSTAGNKTYYYIVGDLDGQNRQGSLSGFGGTSWGENIITFQEIR